MPSEPAAFAEPRIVRRASVSEVIAAELRDMILNGELAPGQRLPGLRSLARTYGVSVVSVRHALVTLVAAGLLQTHHGSGTYVSRTPRLDVVTPPLPAGSPDASEVSELIQARIALEALLARMAATRATSADLRTIRARLREMERAGPDRAHYAQADAAFHLAVAAGARNRVLLRAVYAVRSHLRRELELNLDRGQVVYGEGDWSMGVRSHADLLDALTRRQPARAERIATELITGTWAPDQLSPARRGPRR
ncbi:MAG: FadR family transcriptional regulator [Chloroflexi bacterium]|nr:FadR family transcriptional regulator [Chloroflexota bacterium]